MDIQTPKYWLVISKHYKIAMDEKPSFMFRFFTKLLLGWKYENVEEHI
jgi:hypothetical protein